MSGPIATLPGLGQPLGDVAQIRRDLLEKTLSGLGRPNAPCRPCQEGNAQPLIKRPDGLAEAADCAPHPCRGPGEAASLDDSLKEEQVGDVPAIH